MNHNTFDAASDAPSHGASTLTAPDADPISHLPDETSVPPAARATGTAGFQPRVDESGITLTTESDGKLILVQMSGKLTKSDYRHFVPAVEEAVRKHGKVRMLVRMHNFHGWDAGALWEDTKFDMKHFNHIERLAVVGETNWEKWMAIFCKPFTTATIRYFPSEKTADARAWITTA